MLKRTALFSAHQKLGAKLIDFGGWEMPVQYTSITDEHLAVRNAAGIFDISHMGEVTVSGAAAKAFLNLVLTNEIGLLTPGLGQYTFMCNRRGGVIDDLYAFQLSADVYLLIINASRIEADVAHLKSQWAERQKLPFLNEVNLTDASHNYSAVAVQGPRVKDFINEVISGASISAKRVDAITDLKKNEIGGFKFENQSVLVSRTGYTGEDGFEIIGEANAIVKIWDKVLKIGAPFGIRPCGLGARDTLRTEVCYPLYGHELDEETTPFEAGVGFFVGGCKDYFWGGRVLGEQKRNGTKKKLVAFKMTEKSAPPRPHYPIWANGASVGEVTSGTQSPSLNLGIGMGFVPPEFAKPDTKIEIEIRGKRFAAVVVPKPIYRKSG